jgi:hypothetical protein
VFDLRAGVGDEVTSKVLCRSSIVITSAQRSLPLRAARNRNRLGAGHDAAHTGCTAAPPVADLDLAGDQLAGPYPDP